MCNSLITFDPNIWGTVSDWCIAVVTFGTGFLIWKTLKSQTDTLKLQQTLNDYERIRLKKEIQPFFTHGINSHIKNIQNNYIILLDVFLTNRGEFEAINVIIDYEKTPYQIDNSNFKPHGILPFKHNQVLRNGIINFAMECNVPKPIEGEDVGIILCSLVMRIEFSDLQGNRYVQYLQYIQQDEFIEAASFGLSNPKPLINK